MVQMYILMVEMKLVGVKHDLEAFLRSENYMLVLALLKYENYMH